MEEWIEYAIVNRADGATTPLPQYVPHEQPIEHALTIRPDDEAIYILAETEHGSWIFPFAIPVAALQSLRGYRIPYRIRLKTMRPYWEEYLPGTGDHEPLPPRG